MTLRSRILSVSAVVSLLGGVPVFAQIQLGTASFEASTRVAGQTASAPVSRTGRLSQAGTYASQSTAAMAVDEETLGFAHTLPAETRAEFDQAVDRLDHVDYYGAVEHLAKAAEMSPSHIELQFLLAKWAREQAEISYGDDSLRFYDLSETSLRRLLANPELGPVEKTRASRESGRVREAKDNLRSRDDARLDTGFDVVLQIHDERLESSGQASEDVAKLLEKRLMSIEQSEKKDLVDPWEAAPGANLVEAVQAVAAGGSPVNQFFENNPNAVPGLGGGQPGVEVPSGPISPFEDRDAGAAGPPVPAPVPQPAAQPAAAQPAAGQPAAGNDQWW
ncbi:hypothetical protein HZA57_08510 [Candidatus Poribacteria bacterium]|nr:hypothetical protein [Candidatus Poribacteria bacterium]